MKEKAILDLTSCKYYREFHERIKKSLDFPDHYGANRDAFWDCLTVDCSKQFVTVLGAGTVNKDLKPAVEMLIKLLEKIKKERKIQLQHLSIMKYFTDTTILFLKSLAIREKKVYNMYMYVDLTI